MAGNVLRIINILKTADLHVNIFSFLLCNPLLYSGTNGEEAIEEFLVLGIVGIKLKLHDVPSGASTLPTLLCVRLFLDTIASEVCTVSLGRRGKMVSRHFVFVDETNARNAATLLFVIQLELLWVEIVGVDNLDVAHNGRFGNTVCHSPNSKWWHRRWSSRCLFRSFGICSLLLSRCVLSAHVCSR